MSINLSQYPNYRSNNAAAPSFENQQDKPYEIGVLKSMNIPSTPGELVKYGGLALAFSVFVSKLASWVSTSLPKGNPRTVEDSYVKSFLVRNGDKVDNYFKPISQKYRPILDKSVDFIRKYTPKWIANIKDVIKTGTTPQNSMALRNYKGLVDQSSDYFLELARQLSPKVQKHLKIDAILANKSLSNADAVMKIAEKLNGLNVSKRLTQIPVKGGLFRQIASWLTGGKISPYTNLNLVAELNKTKAFIGARRLLPTKLFQRLFMGSAEAAGGGVIGNSLGILMNALFIASGFKRTAEAPEGEKLKTFMEAAIGDFVGGYLMMLLGTKISYKLLGLKNFGKTPLQISRIDTLTKSINKAKDALKLRELIAKSGLNDKVLRKAVDLGVDATKLQNVTKVDDLLKLLPKERGAAQINKAIDRLIKAKKYNAKGLSGLLMRPVAWVAKMFSVGLGSTPAKLAQSGSVSAFRAAWQSFKNGAKHFLGFPARFILVMFIITPPLQRLCVKLSHSLFGKPTNSAYDDNEEKVDNSKKISPSIDMDNFVNFSNPNHYTGYVPSVIPTKFNTENEQNKGDLKEKVGYVPDFRSKGFDNSEIAAKTQQVIQSTMGLDKYTDRVLKETSKF